MMRRVISILILMVCARDVRATVLVPAEFREIVAGSQVIVYGRVTAVRAEWSDDRSRIDTLVTVMAGSYLKGGPGSTVTFRVPGGQIGRYRNVMIGAPQLQAGEEAVLFLSASGPSIAHIFGLSQGLYRVKVDSRTGRRMVVPPVLMTDGDGSQTIVRGDTNRRQLSLDEFAATVRQAMSGGAR
ncbi:MAG: hypothetical protein ACJ731_14270 [Vicinamibacterales bacterium]